MTTAPAQGHYETSDGEQPQRLHRGALGLVDISASTMANIGPAYSFYFGFGFLAITAGVAAPLEFVVAGIAIALLGNTIAQFTRVLPSTGGFITFVGKAFGARSAVVTALLCGAGYMIAVSSVLAVSGGFLSITVEKYFHWNIPWGIFSVIITIGAVMTMIRGVGLSTKLAGLFFGFEMLILIIVSIAAHHQERRPPEPDAVRAEPHLRRAQGPRGRASRWRSTPSSAGRTPRRWPRRPTTRGATCRAPSSCRSA